MIAGNGEEFIEEIERMEIWRFQRLPNDTTTTVEEMKNEQIRGEKAKFNWKWYKLRLLPHILLLLLTVTIVHSPIQLVMAKLRNVNNGYCEFNSG